MVDKILIMYLQKKIDYQNPVMLLQSTQTIESSLKKYSNTIETNYRKKRRIKEKIKSIIKSIRKDQQNNKKASEVLEYINSFIKKLQQQKKDHGNSFNFSKIFALDNHKKQDIQDESYILRKMMIFSRELLETVEKNRNIIERYLKEYTISQEKTKLYHSLLDQLDSLEFYIKNNLNNNIEEFKIIRRYLDEISQKISKAVSLLNSQKYNIFTLNKEENTINLVDRKIKMRTFKNKRNQNAIEKMQESRKKNLIIGHNISDKRTFIEDYTQKSLIETDIKSQDHQEKKHFQEENKADENRKKTQNK